MASSLDDSPGMSAHEGYSNDFEFLNDPDDNVADFGAFQFLDGAAGDGPRVDFSFLGPSKTVAPAEPFDPSTGAFAHSPSESFKDSSSDSSSSKRTRSSISSKPSLPKMADIAMGDAFEHKPECNFDDYVHFNGEDDVAQGAYVPGNGTIDPARISNLGAFGTMQSTDDAADFDSPSSGSGDFAIGAADTPSPDFSINIKPTKKHAKAYSVRRPSALGHASRVSR